MDESNGLIGKIASIDLGITTDEEFEAELEKQRREEELEKQRNHEAGLAKVKELIARAKPKGSSKPAVDPLALAEQKEAEASSGLVFKHRLFALTTHEDDADNQEYRALMGKILDRENDRFIGMGTPTRSLSSGEGLLFVHVEWFEVSEKVAEPMSKERANKVAERLDY